MFVLESSGGVRLRRHKGGTTGSRRLSSLRGTGVFLFQTLNFRFQTENAMTELMYQTDSYLKEFDATVTDVSGDLLALDCTSFYPGGGGQPHDLGSLSAGGQTWNVLRVKKEGDMVWHQFAPSACEGP